MDRQARTGLKDLAPDLAYGSVSDQSRAAGVNANDFLVFGPHSHHRLQVGFFERFVERALAVLRAGENPLSHRA